MRWDIADVPVGQRMRNVIPITFDVASRSAETEIYNQGILVRYITSNLPYWDGSEVTGELSFEDIRHSGIYDPLYFTRDLMQPTETDGI